MNGPSVRCVFWRAIGWIVEGGGANVVGTLNSPQSLAVFLSTT